MIHGLVVFFLLQNNPGGESLPQGQVEIEMIESHTPETHEGALKARQKTPPEKSLPPTPSAETTSSQEENSETALRQGPSANGSENETANENRGASLKSAYISQMAEIIRQHRVYPRAALDREQEGRVVIEVVVDPAGQVQEVSVAEPSPYSLLNEAALATLRKVQRFPKPPGEFHENHFLVPLVFKIESKGN